MVLNEYDDRVSSHEAMDMDMDDGHGSCQGICHPEGHEPLLKI